MKKLNLQALGLNAKEVLSRDQLKQITGGDDICCTFDQVIWRCQSQLSGVHYVCGTDSIQAANTYAGTYCYPTACSVSCTR